VCFVDLFSSFAFLFSFRFVCVVCGGRKVNFVAAFFLLSAAFVDFCRRQWISSSWLYDAVAGGCECGEREKEREKKTASVVVVLVQRSRRSTRQMCCVLSLFRCVASKEGAGRYSHDVPVHVFFTRFSLNLFSCFVSSVGCFFTCLFGDLAHDLQGNSRTDRQKFLRKRDCYRARRAVRHSLDLRLLCGAYLL
jgi:hypothetical protein